MYSSVKSEESLQHTKLILCSWEISSLFALLLFGEILMVCVAEQNGVMKRRAHKFTVNAHTLTVT